MRLIRSKGRRGPFDTRSGERALAPAISTYPRLFTDARHQAPAFPRIFGGALCPVAAPGPLIRRLRSRPLRYRIGRSNPAFPKERVGGIMQSVELVWIESWRLAAFSPRLPWGEGGRRPDEGSVTASLKPLVSNAISPMINPWRMNTPHPPVGTFSPPERRGEGG
jgi:hypothetical protein